MSKADWKIYTRKGDQGNTTLIGGTIVPKTHIRVIAYGSVDELNSFVGLLHEKTSDKANKLFLRSIMNTLFLLESNLAFDPNTDIKPLFPEVNSGETLSLENEIDRLNEALPDLTRFILPAGGETAALAHVCRTTCRRAERAILALNDQQAVHAEILRYINRLSDYFFVLARWEAHAHGSGDIEWVTK